MRMTLPSLCFGLLITACAPDPQAPVAATTAAQPPTALPPPAPGPPTTANEVLAQARAPFDACYAKARLTRPDIGRTSVEITFTRDDQDKLLTVELQYRNRMDDAAKECMKNAAEALKFPPSMHGTQIGTIQFAPPP